MGMFAEHACELMLVFVVPAHGNRKTATCIAAKRQALFNCGASSASALHVSRVHRLPWCVGLPCSLHAPPSACCAAAAPA